MHYITTRLVKVFSLLTLHVFVYPTICFSGGLDFLDTKDPQGITILRRDVKIPIGVADGAIHNLTVEKGTLVSGIPSKISQKRQELGFSPHIPWNQQDTFFQDLSWKTTQDITKTAPMPGTVIQVFVEKGQHVTRGDALCILDTMKMHTTIRSAYSGIIDDFFIGPGKSFDKNSVLLTLLPTSPIWEDIDQAQILESKDLLIPFFPWAMSSPVEISNTHADTSPNGEQENETGDAIAEEEHNQSTQTLQEGNLSFPSIQNPPSDFVQMFPEESVFIEQNPIPLPIFQAEGSIPFTRNEQEIEQQNSPILNAPPTSETSILTPRAYPHSLEGLDLQNSDLPFKFEFKNDEKEAKESSFSKTKALSKEKVINKSEYKLDFPISSWIKWIFGLLVLGKLIVLTKITNKYGPAYLRSRTLHVYNFKNYRFINEKIANNINSTPWRQEKRLKMHALLGY